MSVRDLGIRHFAALCAVVDEGTFAKAGAALGFSQSAISQQIGAIERAIGAPVFDRLGGARRVTLTPAGRILVDHAELVLRQLAEADDELERLAAGTEGTIVVGTFQSVSVKVLPEAIGRIRRQRPGVEIRLVENDEQNDLVEALRSGSLDVSFVVEPIRDDAIATIRLCDDPFVALCPIDDRAVQPHPGSRRDGRRDVLPVAALKGGALIGQPDQFCGQAPAWAVPSCRSWRSIPTTRTSSSPTSTHRYSRAASPSPTLRAPRCPPPLGRSSLQRSTSPTT